MIYIAMQKLKAIIFDKDDTIMQDQVYNPAFSIEYFFDDIIPSCLKFKNLGYNLFIISNQSGISRGNFEEKVLISNYINLNFQLHKKYSFSFDGFLYCTHVASYNCICRKPLKGLYTRLNSYFQIDNTKSFYIGDRLTDILFAQASGIFPIIIHRDDYLYKDPTVYKDLTEIEILEENGKTAIFSSLIEFANLIEFNNENRIKGRA